MPNAQILVADDDPAMLGTLSWILKEQGYDVVSTPDGNRVLSLMEERTPDLVLLDVLFGDANGTDVLEAIKRDERWRDVPIVMMSALSPEEAAVRTLGIGAADYVRKPFRVRELLARIQAQLRMRSILTSAHETLREAREALSRVQGEADQRRHLMDIMHDVTAELSTGEIYHLLARRVARALGLSQCSVVLTKLGGPPRVAAYAYETGSAAISFWTWTSTRSSRPRSKPAGRCSSRMSWSARCTSTCVRCGRAMESASPRVR